MHKLFWIILVILAAFAVSMALRNRGHRARQNTLRATMDAADMLESEIRAARTALQSSNLEVATANDALESAMRDLLKQRMWLQANSATADTASLERVLIGLQEAIRQMRQFSAR